MVALPVYSDEYAQTLSAEELPEVKMWLYALAEAIRLASLGSIQEYDWLHHSDDWHVGSYLWICEVCDIDPDNLRHLLDTRPRPKRSQNRASSIILNRGSDIPCRTNKH